MKLDEKIIKIICKNCYWCNEDICETWDFENKKPKGDFIDRCPVIKIIEEVNEDGTKNFERLS